MDLTKLSDADLMALRSGDLSKVSTEGLMAMRGQSVGQPQQPVQQASDTGKSLLNKALAASPAGMIAGLVSGDKDTLQGVKDAIAGGVRGAGSIGSTLYEATPIGTAERMLKGKGFLESRKNRVDDMDYAARHIGADPESATYQAGKVGTEIAGTAGIGGALGQVVSNAGKSAPYAQKLASALESGGLKLGSPPANTVGGKIADMLTRTGAGAASGAAMTGAVNPEDTGTGAVIGGILPGGVKLAAGAGRKLASGMNSAAESLMQSAIKPTIKQLQTGDAAIAVRTLLDNGISPNAAGVDKLRSLVSDKNQKIAELIKNSTASVDKSNVISALDDVTGKFSRQVSPTSDLSAIKSVADDFMAHPVYPGSSIPVQAAQELKQGTYKTLANKYGQIGSAETEAQKGLARGLKDEIARLVPEVGPLNAEETNLIKTLKVTERRALMEMNKNPVGLAALASNPKGFALFMADKSAAFKALAARMINASQAAPNSLGQAENLLAAPVARAAITSSGTR